MAALIVSARLDDEYFGLSSDTLGDTDNMVNY